MKLTNYCAIAASCLAMSACASTATSDGPASGDLFLRGSGGGNWSIECDADTKRGSSRPSINGVGSDDSAIIAIQDVYSASCTYKAGNRALMVSLAERGLTCPFGAFEDELCRAEFVAGSEGSFDFSVE